MKLTFWHIACEDDSSAYDIRETTKKAAIARRKDLCGRYSETVSRITIEYANGFELLDIALGEGSWQVMVIDRKDYPVYPGKNDLLNVPAAACLTCGGWTSQGGMSQHSNAIETVMGRTGCDCHSINF